MALGTVQGQGSVDMECVRLLGFDLQLLEFRGTEVVDATGCVPTEAMHFELSASLKSTADLNAEIVTPSNAYGDPLLQV